MRRKQNGLLRMADGAAATSASLASIAIFAELEPIVTILAGLAAIFAAVFAALYHYEMWRELRDKKK